MTKELSGLGFLVLGGLFTAKGVKELIKEHKADKEILTKLKQTEEHVAKQKMLIKMKLTLDNMVNSLDSFNSKLVVIYNSQKELNTEVYEDIIERIMKNYRNISNSIIKLIEEEECEDVISLYKQTLHKLTQSTSNAILAIKEKYQELENNNETIGGN